MGILDGLFGGIGSLVGGLLGYEGAKDQNAEQLQIAQQNMAAQREFAQQGIQWKVADARAAGINPLAALGASTSSFSPVTVGSVNEMAPLADMAGHLGQDLSRAVHATRSEDERANAVESTANQLKLKNMDLQNQLLSAQIAKISRPAVGPGMPLGQYLSLPGQGDTPVVWPAPKSPQEREQINAGAPWMSNPAFSQAQTVQNQYGDIAEDVYGIGVKLPADVYYNWMQNYSPRIAKHLWRHRYELNPFGITPAN